MVNTSDPTRMRKILVRGLGWCICVAVWTAALLTTYPVRVGEAVASPTLYFPAAKCLHVSAYAFLTVYLTWIPLGRWRWLLLAFLSVHAAGTEFGQLFVPDRYGQFSDVLIDHFGLALGMALTWKRWLLRPNSHSVSCDPKGSAIFRFAPNDPSRSPSGRG